ncbi:cupin domain-containing protein [Telmatocola sphagniphila]|uniref:Cupin domain-containing protein n=1 Tax=Telmatocola sphagniphila TaxID=1123043 RepID=A0A8E6EZZ4_9BACT|nr:cupin domain-containing protein [Telmatocola sphagniphila]QVL33986.1 cupin domain-containing protein [Telmatocola sphagniphila]
MPPGGGPPHVHSREEEGIYILEGEITFTVDGEKIVAKAVAFVNMPVGIPHSLKNESGNPAKMLIFIAPAGLKQMFFEFGVPLAKVLHELFEAFCSRSQTAFYNWKYESRSQKML